MCGRARPGTLVTPHPQPPKEPPAMSTRTLAGTALAVGALALPAAANARPAEQFDSGNPLAVSPTRQVDDSTTIVIEHTRHPGSDTLLVLGLAGGSSLIGARVGGVGGSRAMTRR